MTALDNTPKFQFTTHEGTELVATLMGEPGSRQVFISKHGQDYGSFSLKQLLNSEISMFAPRGEVQTCSEDDLILIDLVRVNALAQWVQSVALGRDEGEQE